VSTAGAIPSRRCQRGGDGSTDIHDGNPTGANRALCDPERADRDNKKGAVMSTITMHATTSSTPEQYTAALTDFGPGRSEIFGNSADSYLKVHDQGPDHADVTEGSGGVWERLRYDWSNPERVVAQTVDSNAWGGRSGHTYRYTRNANGTTDIDYVVVREGKNFKGRFLGIVLGSVGKSKLTKAFDNSVKAVEARNNPAQASNP
jgi:hypothetical protein